MDILENKLALALDSNKSRCVSPPSPCPRSTQAFAYIPLVFAFSANPAFGSSLACESVTATSSGG